MRHWESLVRAAASALFRRYQTYAEDLVADLIADIAAGAFPNLPEKSDTLVAFARGVIRNRAKQVNRREARLLRFADLRQIAEVPARVDTDAWRSALRAQLARDIAAASAYLTPREAEIAQLHWIEAWPTTDIASRLGIAPRTVKELLRRARRKLNQLLRCHYTAAHANGRTGALDSGPAVTRGATLSKKGDRSHAHSPVRSRRGTIRH